MYAIVAFILLHKQPWQRAAVVYTFSGKNLCICMLFDAKNSATYFQYNKMNKKLSFRRLLDPLWLVLYVLWLYVCHPWRECRLNMVLPTHFHNQITPRHLEGGGLGAKR